MQNISASKLSLYTLVNFKTSVIYQLHEPIIANCLKNNGVLKNNNDICMQRLTPLELRHTNDSMAILCKCSTLNIVNK